MGGRTLKNKTWKRLSIVRVKMRTPGPGGEGRNHVSFVLHVEQVRLTGKRSTQVQTLRDRAVISLTKKGQWMLREPLRHSWGISSRACLLSCSQKYTLQHLERCQGTTPTLNRDPGSTLLYLAKTWFGQVCGSSEHIHGPPWKVI